MTEPYNPNETCWFCGQNFDKPDLALKVSGCATRGRTVAFCGLNCLLGWATEHYTAKQRERKIKPFPQVVVQDDILSIIPAGQVIP